MSPVAVALAILVSAHLPAATADAVAQSLVARGLFFYYAYDDADAADTFAAASELAPRLAVAYWGEALAAGPNLNTPMTEDRFMRGQEAMRKTAALGTDVASAERASIAAMASRFQGTWADWARDDGAYRQAMARLADSADADDDIRVLAAEALLEHGTLTWDGAQLATADSRHALALVNGVLARDPQNVMANHLCIHIYDDATDRTPASSCAQRLDAADLPPQGEHLAHMPAHYWIETGNYAAAVASSERAYLLFEQLKRSDGRNPEHDRYLQHDVYVGYSAAMMLGNYSTARAWSTRMHGASATSYEALTALRFGRFADAYRLASDSTVADLAVRGFAALALGRIDDARIVDARLRKFGEPGYLAELFLARFAETDGDFDDAARWIDRAVAEQAAAYSGESIPLLPALEARAGLAMRRRRYDDAVAAYRATLATYPGDPRALYGLSEALRAQSLLQQAERIRAQFTADWGANPIPVLDI